MKKERLQELAGIQLNEATTFDKQAYAKAIDTVARSVLAQLVADGVVEAGAAVDHSEIGPYLQHVSKLISDRLDKIMEAGK